MASQHVLFEEDGAFRAGTVLSGTEGALQVELASGKRVKVKAAHVLLRYDAPAPAEFREPILSLAASVLVLVPLAIVVWRLAHARARRRGSLTEA